jgi:8-oxo-dGTP pyrophosphatase MutT (NUDIX family)
VGRRIDYYDDPEAPPANSIKPSAGTFVLRAGSVLLIRRDDNGNWTMPGGAQDPGESLSRTAVRETLEETGITVELVGIVGIFTDPRHVIHYTSNNEVRQEFTVIYRAEYVSGEPTTSNESTHVEWVEVGRLEGLPMDRSQRIRLDWALSHSEPFIDSATH